MSAVIFFIISVCVASLCTWLVSTRAIAFRYKSLLAALLYVTLSEVVILLTIAVGFFSAFADVLAIKFIFFMPLTIAGAFMLMSAAMRSRIKAIALSAVGWMTSVAFILMFPAYGAPLWPVLFTSLPLLVLIVSVYARLSLTKVAYVAGLAALLASIVFDGIIMQNDSYLFLIFAYNAICAVAHNLNLFKYRAK